MKKVIFTDGSSRGNPGPGGWGAVIVSDDIVTEIGGREEMTTNNKMELTACIEGLKQAGPADQIIVYSDSQYVIKGITEWIHDWQVKGWKNSQRKAVMNRELWEELLAVSKGQEIIWKYVKGHAETAGNIRCDEIATRFADNENFKLFNGSKDKYPFTEIIRSVPV